MSGQGVCKHKEVEKEESSSWLSGVYVCECVCKEDNVCS